MGLYFHYLIISLTATAAFEVQTPKSLLIAVYGHQADLECVFSPSTDPDPSLVVTWQRAEDSKVIHSFYHGTDQLDSQSREYHNRTMLYHSQFPRGNASLRLERVGPGDEGRYLCSVNNMKGTGKAEVQLKYAAFYTEPRLTVQCHLSNVTFLYESEGYPEPDVQWRDTTGGNLTFNTTVSPSPRNEGLLSLRSQLVVEHTGGVYYTFSLRNPLLEQVIERPVSLSYASSGNAPDHTRHRLTLLPIIAALVLTLAVLRPTCHGSS